MSYTRPLGRRVPSDFAHVAAYGYGAVVGPVVQKVEKILGLPSWHWSWDQGQQGACVGFGLSMMMSILNEHQAKTSHLPPYVRRYNAEWLWNEAKRVDEFPDTNPGDDNGTTVRAGCDVLRTLGHERVVGHISRPADIAEGIKENRWATTIDEIRTAISKGIPVAIGVNWYSAFDKPTKHNGDWIIPSANLGPIRGGHCVTLYGASDNREGFKLKNSWGRDYPLVWLPYNTMQRLLKEAGEACLVTDR